MRTYISDFVAPSETARRYEVRISPTLYKVTIMILTTYSTDSYHHPPQHHNATILEAAGTHSSYLSTTLDCWTFSLECFTKTVISIL